MKANKLQRRPGRVASHIVTLVLAVSSGLSVNLSAQTDLPPLADRDRAMTMPGEFVLASVGDLMIRRPASRSPTQKYRQFLN